MSRDTALKFYLVARDHSKDPKKPGNVLDFPIENFVIAAYSEEEALDVHPAYYFIGLNRFKTNNNLLPLTFDDYLYSKHPEVYPKLLVYNWVKNPKEDAYVRELGYVSEEAQNMLKNQTIIAINSYAFAATF